jgi:hypothetical protein
MAVVRFVAKKEIFLNSIASRPAMKPTQPSYPVGTWCSFPAACETHQLLHLVPRSRMMELYLFPHMSSISVKNIQGLLYFS